MSTDISGEILRADPTTTVYLEDIGGILDDLTILGELDSHAANTEIKSRPDGIARSVKITKGITAALRLNPESSQSWQDQANCLGVDPDLFFPKRGASTKEAKEVCGQCDVRLVCLEYALVNGEKVGIWGGLSERERRRIRGQRFRDSKRTQA